eukprot:scaffold13523_cov92-Isochrysis_galbana.AAC.2
MPQGCHTIEGEQAQLKPGDRCRFQVPQRCARARALQSAAPLATAPDRLRRASSTRPVRSSTMSRLWCSATWIWVTAMTACAGSCAGTAPSSCSAFSGATCCACTPTPPSLPTRCRRPAGCRPLPTGAPSRGARGRASSRESRMRAFRRAATSQTS